MLVTTSVTHLARQEGTQHQDATPNNLEFQRQSQLAFKLSGCQVSSRMLSPLLGLFRLILPTPLGGRQRCRLSPLFYKQEAPGSEAKRLAQGHTTGDRRGKPRWVFVEPTRTTHSRAKWPEVLFKVPIEVAGKAPWSSPCLPSQFVVNARPVRAPALPSPACGPRDSWVPAAPFPMLPRESSSRAARRPPCLRSAGARFHHLINNPVLTWCSQRTGL